MNAERILPWLERAILLIALLLAFNAYCISQGLPMVFDLKTPLAEAWEYAKPAITGALALHVWSERRISK